MAKGLCPSAVPLLERDMSTYAANNAGRKELMRNVREAFRDQMEFEGKNRHVRPLLHLAPTAELYSMY